MSSLSTLTRSLNTLLVVSSGVVFGVLAMTAVVAAVVFPKMRELDPTLPGYPAYDGAHWSLAAGIVAERVFDIGFVIAGVSVAGCIAGVLGLAVTRGRSGMPIVRLGLTLIVTALFCTHVGWLQRRMDQAAGEYRAGAAAGDSAVAHEAKARFDAMHPTASRLISGATLAGLALFGVSAWQAGGPRRGADGEGSA
ncbi:MAG: hypothetical protein IT431_09480 [Phycisphaerales bacterium]|nr:hypothetical protein [Phycisphaerales bacterium]